MEILRDDLRLREERENGDELSIDIGAVRTRW